MSAAPRLRLAALLASAALLCGGCSLTAGRGGDITGSVGSAPMTEKAARAQLESLAERYRTNPGDTANAMR